MAFVLGVKEIAALQENHIAQKGGKLNVMSPDDAAMMLNCGWSIQQIAEHFHVTTEEVIAAIRQHAREEREELKETKS